MATMPSSLAESAIEVLALQHAAGLGCFERVGRDGIPAAEQDVVERRQGTNSGSTDCVLFLGPEADVCHLAAPTRSEAIPRRGRRTPAMNVEATAPRPGVRTPSLPAAGAISRFVMAKD